MTIMDWPVNDRPREKLLKLGSHTLSDAELLAIFLRTGIPGKTAVDLARELLVSFGSLRGLLEATKQEFCQGVGLGMAKYALLQASLEMSTRYKLASIDRFDQLSSAEQVRSYLTSKLRGYQYEVFLALFLDSQHRLITSEELFQGTINGASVYPREIVKKVLYHNAAAVIFAHNHPSGVAEPSDADMNITARLIHALDLIDVKVLDHFVVGDQEIVSFAERGLL